MPARAVTVITVIAATLVLPTAAAAQQQPAAPCCKGGNDGGGAGGDVSPGGEVGAWVGDGGNIHRPPGTGSCSGWDHATNLNPTPGVDDVATVRQTPDGRIWDLFYRICDGIGQWVWVPRVTGEDLAWDAFDRVVELLPTPTVTLSPAGEVGGFVNFPTWLSVTTVVPVAVTAGPMPNGLSATTTAVPGSIMWLTGDGSEFSCGLWGDLPPVDADQVGLVPSCGWTPTVPSAPVYGAEADGRFHGEVRIVWTVTWTSTDGDGGDLGTVTSDVPVAYRVREIQTIGMDR